MDRIMQFPFTAPGTIETAEEAAARMLEKKREQGRRLQAQAATVREEKLRQREQDVAAYLAAKELKSTEKKGDYAKRLQAFGFRTEKEMDETIAKLQKSITRARNKDLGIEEEEIKEIPTFPLVNIPDHQLTEEQIKEKRKQKLNKAGYDARMRMKAEKDAAKAREAEAKRLDEEHRLNNYESWLAEKRQAHVDAMERIKERKKLNEQLGDRKSLAAQNRMKTITNMASEAPAAKKKRKKAGDEDTFGADDEDWAVYRAIREDDSEAEEDELEQLQKVEENLLKYDPEFTIDETAARKAIRKQRLLNAFIRGMAPDDPLDSFEPANPEHAAQLHLNMERIRVPEVTYQPSLAGIDSAGLLEVIEHILKSFNAQERDRLTNNIYLTGGYSLVSRFDERLKRELTSVLPVGSPLTVRRAADAQLDAWKGLASFAKSPAYGQTCITRAEYLEKGGEYMKEHALSNSYEMLSL